MNRRRQPPMRLTVPVYDGPVKQNDLAEMENARRRNLEIFTARGTRKSQRLSNHLAWTYQRNVFADGGLPEGMWAVKRELGSLIDMRSELPPEEFLFAGTYHGVSCAWDVAERLLARDGRMVG